MKDVTVMIDMRYITYTGKRYIISYHIVLSLNHLFAFIFTIAILYKILHIKSYICATKKRNDYDSSTT